MRTIISVLLLMSGMTSFGQNNPIFGGGPADGWNITTFVQAENNIFTGGNNDGFSRAAFSQTENNIFNGGNADGWGRTDFAQLLNNIFDGGNGDGWSNVNFSQAGNNIFPGGNGDGWSNTNFAQAGNNIFPGGIGDGWASTYRPMAPLPVQFIEFTAVRYGKMVSMLQWKTATEQNSSHFEVERSADAIHFLKIGRTAAAGSSGSMREYQFIDQAAMPGMNYYRIRQVDLNGRSTLTPARLVRFDEQVISPLNVYPNPTTGVVFLDLRGLPAQGLSAVTITAANGEVKDQQRMTLNAPQIITIDLTRLTAGTYFVQFVSMATKQTMKVIKL